MRDKQCASSTGVRRSLALSLLGIVIADFLFFNHPVGWTLGLYGFILLALLGAGIPLPCLAGATHKALGGGLLGLCLALAYRPTPLAAFLALLFLVTLSMSVRCGGSGRATIWAERWIRFVVSGWLQIVRDSSHAPVGGNRLAQGLKSLVRWSPVLVLALVFAGLFASANPIIADWIEAAGSWLERMLLTLDVPAPARILLWGGIGLFIYILLRYCPPEAEEREERSSPICGSVLEFFLSPTTITGGLALFNVLFLVQNLLDIGYLWGGATLPEGMTYAEYAHRGAYPLVVTALLAAGFVLVAFRPSGDSRQSRLSRRLVFLWIAQNIVLTAAAGWRLTLYVEVYSLTRLRLAAAIWMLLVALGLVWICVRIISRRSNVWLININALTLLVVLYICTFANIPGIISRYNTRHCHEISGSGAHLDIGYLESLGPESIPALIWVRENTEDERVDTGTAKVLQRLRSRLREDMHDWRGWTWRRHRLMRGIE